MRAIILNDFGGTEQLIQQDIPNPGIKDDEVLVRSHAIGLNPVDVKTRKGKGQAARLRNEHPMILGWDISGEVVEVGKNVTRFNVGDEVFGMINLPGAGKAYAEYVAAPDRHLTMKPANVSHEEAAAASLAAMTAWQAVVDKAEIKAGQKILVHAAAGGVGHYAVQIARHFGAYVIGTSSADNKGMVMSLGTDEHIDYKAVRFEDVCSEVDIVLETIGGDNIDRSLKVLKAGGTIVSLPSGVSEDVKDKAAAQDKNGIFFFVQSNFEDMDMIAALLESGEIKSHVSKRFSFDQIREAHELLESGRTVGKIVLTL